MNKIIGALWNKSKDGAEYLSGVINDIRGEINVVVFPNTYKKAENQPDFNIVLSFDRPIKNPEKDIKKNRKKKEDLPF